MSDTPSQPAAPDPTVTAQAQTASNVQTANANAILNRVNQTTPWGTQTYTPGTPNADGTSQWSSNVTLAPAQQSLLDSSNQISQSMADLGQSQIGNVSSALAKPLDFSGLPQLTNNPLQSSVSAGPVQDSIAPSGAIQGSLDNSNLGKLATSAGSAGTAGSVSRDGVTPLVGGDALGKSMSDAQNAAYNQSQSRLDPQWNQQQHDLQNQLTQQGVMQNSDAWNRSMDAFSRNRTDAYQTAQNNAVGLGNAAEAQLYGQGLSSNQNAFGQNLADSQLTNQAASINNAQGIANAQLQNSANAQQYGQNLGTAQFGNTAQAQAFGQNEANATFGNNAQNQTFGQGMYNAQLGNSAAGQNFSQSDTARNQGINELLQQQQNPLNVLNALRTGSQVTSPTFGQTPQTNVAGTNTSGITQQGYNNGMGLYNSQVGTNNANTAAGAHLGAAALTAMF